MYRRRRLVAAWLLLCCGGGLAPPLLADTSTTDLGATLPVENGGIRFVGEASPGALVSFERDGAVIGTQVAAGDSTFDDSFPSELQGTYTYSLFATDTQGQTTDPISQSVTISPGATVTLSGLLLPPTLRVTTNPIKRPQTQVVHGLTRQNSTVTVVWSGARYGDSFTSQSLSDANGNWSSTPGQTLHLGTYSVSAITQEPGGALSPQTTTQSFPVVLSADLNNDGRVNLTDFSILMFYYGQSGVTKPADINDDGKANLTDFSIMLFYWTG